MNTTFVGIFKTVTLVGLSLFTLYAGIVLIVVAGYFAYKVWKKHKRGQNEESL